jgi:hypothetical protein
LRTLTLGSWLETAFMGLLETVLRCNWRRELAGDGHSQVVKEDLVLDIIYVYVRNVLVNQT